jgi:hypothetical protein
MAKTTSLFETEHCGRCGGSGHYSYCQMHGTTCFGCAGSGRRLTKRGKAAQAWLVAQQTKPASEVQVGDRVWERDYFRGRVGWFRVTAVEGDTVHLMYTDKGDSTKEVHEMSVQGGNCRVRPVDKFWVLWQQAVALCYQASLTKAGKVPAKKGRK